MTLHEQYEILCKTPSDINEHLPVLKDLSSRCAHVTEMGVRGGVSTIALACGHPMRMVSYDINPVLDAVVGMILEAGVDFQFFQRDVRHILIEATDLLFIDTLHTYDQLKTELALHASKVRKFVAFHDTVTFGVHGEDGKTPALLKAIADFFDPTMWVRTDYTNNNGLTVMARRGM